MIRWAPVILALPFFEGGASPEGLLVTHLLFLFGACLWMMRAQRADPSLAAAALGVLGVAALSGALSSYRFAALVAWMDLAFPVVLFLMLEAEARWAPDRIGGLLRAIALSGFVQAAGLLSVWAARGFSRAPAGTLLNGDHAAAYLLLAFWALMARPPRRVLAVPAALVLAGGVVVLASRGALVATVVGGGTWLMAEWNAMGRKARLLAASLALGAGLAVGAGVAARLVTQSDPYRWDRPRLWAAAMGMARAQPVLGIGPGLFPHESAPFDIPHADGPVRFSKHMESTHSDYVRIVTETGVLGVLSFGCFAALILRRAQRGMWVGGAGGAALAAALAGLGAHMAFENLSARPAVTGTGAVLVALLAARGHPGPHAVASMAVGPLTRLLAVGGSAACAFTLVLCPWLGHRAFQAYRARVGDLTAQWQAAVRWNPIHPSYRAALAEAVLAGRSRSPADLRAGFVAIDAALTEKPRGAELWLLRARLSRLAFSSGEGVAEWIDLADADYARAVALDPHRPQARLERGWMLLSVGRAEEALEEAAGAIEGEPNSFEARRLRVSSLLELGRREEAGREIEEAQRRSADVLGWSPRSAYEEQVLRWDRDGWESIGTRLKADPSSGTPR